MKQYRYDDAFDENGVLRDGHVGRVRMMLRDGGDGSQYRAGFRTGDTGMRDAKEKAYDTYEKNLTEAWRGDARKRKSVTRDPEGRLLSEEEEEFEDAKKPLRDNRTLDQVRRDHERNMARVYQTYEQGLIDAWKGGK